MKLSTCSISIILVAFGAASAWAGADEGKAIFDKACKSCHGADGAGNPTIAKMMKVEIPALSSAAVQALPDADLRAVVTKGKGKMKPVASVTGNQVDDVIAFVRTLKK
jgi:mono/diheme cytochrome c family protein